MQPGNNPMTKESQYLFIKQKLDSYNISTTFPLEVMPLLHSLISKLDQSTSKSKHSPIVATNPKPQTSENPQFQQIQPALRHQLQRTLSLNNTLHMQLITQKQQIQSLKHCIDKMALEAADLSKRDEVRQVIGMCRDKERELVEELQVVKFKYNELVDFVMGEDELQKMYIKKLINHKKYEDVSDKEKKEETTKNNINKSAQDLNSRITFKAGSSRKQSRQRIDKTIESKQNSHPQESQPVKANKAQSSQSHEYRLYELQQKLAHRQNNQTYFLIIKSDDGPNLTRVMTQFTHELQQQQYSKLQQRINFLETQNHQVKQKLQNSKLNGGRYQALIEEVQKSHSLINELRKQNLLIRRQQKQQEFDLDKEKKEYKRQANLTEFLKDQLKEARHKDQILINDLRQKVKFYERELGIKERNAEEETHKIKNQIANGKMKKNMSKKNIKTSKSKTTKSKQAQQTKTRQDNPAQVKAIKQASSLHPEYRQKYEDQISLNSSSKKQQDAKVTKHKQPKKPVKKLPISQIIEEEQEEESYIKPQQNGESIGASGHKAKSEKNKDYEQSNQGQGKQPVGEEQNQVNNEQEHDQSQGEQDSLSEKNETMIQQYQQTINELSARCLQLKQQLASKNQTIKGLQQIANRLIHNKDNSQTIPNGSNTTSENQSQSIPHLTHQIQNLSALLNESQFQKQQLRRELIRVQTLYNNVKSTGQVNHSSSQSNSLEQQLDELKKLLEHKDSKITDMRQDNTKIQDQHLKALDRIRRLNDEIDAITKENQTLKNSNQKLMHDLSLNQARLEQAALLLKQQRERNSNTLELSQIEKDQIIVLKKGLIKAEQRIKQMEQELQALREQNQRLVSQLS